VEVVIEQPSGALIVASESIDPIYDRAGKQAGAINVFQDISERQMMEAALRESEARFRSLISQVKDYAIFSTDDRGVVTTWNEGCQCVLGYSEEELIGLDRAELFTAEDRADGIPAGELERARAAGTTRHERWMLAKGGRRFFAMGATAGLRDTAGRPGGFSTVMRDMTQMKLSQDELAHHGESLERLVTERTEELEKTTERLRLSERMASLGTLSAGLGHDLGNLLLPLDVRLGLLLEADLPPELREHVVGIQTCAQYLQRLSNGLRLLAVDPSSAPATEATELRAWWTEAAMMLRSVLPSGVRLEHELPASECWVALGPAGLTQAVFNLVQNSADALGERGSGSVRVSLTDAPEAEAVMVRVSDDGPGMTEEVMRRSMEPYYTTKSRGLSTGMGLAFVHALVTGAGGRVEIDSTPGGGTTIALNLPRARPERPIEHPTPRVARLDLQDGRMRSFIGGELKRLGFDVRRVIEEDAEPSLIVTEPARLDGVADGGRMGRRQIIVLGELDARHGALGSDGIVVLGRNRDPEAICAALRQAAERIHAT
jgi:PAS domain S-box-containing protein